MKKHTIKKRKCTDTLSRIAGIAAAMTICCACAWSCSDKKTPPPSSAPEVVTDPEEETTASTEAPSEEESTVSAETTSESVTTGTTAAEETSAAVTTTAQKETEAPKKGKGTSFEAAQAYYNAYISGNADAVYELFCEDEIEGYNAYLSTTELLEGKNPQVVFKRSNVISAIEESISVIHEIMAANSDVPAGKWSVSLTEGSLTPIEPDELKEFNDTLGTAFTSADDCRRVFYMDGDPEHDFVGNGCAFVELDGRWYLSYTTVMNAELITYMDIY